MKINKELIRKNRSELTFSLISFLMIIVIGWFLVFNINFLVSSFNDAYNIETSPAGDIGFNIEKAEQLLIRIGNE